MDQFIIWNLETLWYLITSDVFCIKCYNNIFLFSNDNIYLNNDGLSIIDNELLKTDNEILKIQKYQSVKYDVSMDLFMMILLTMIKSVEVNQLNI